MRKFLKRGWVIFCFVVTAACLASCLTPWINPQKLSYLSVLALLFPYLFSACFLCCLSLFFIHKKAAIITLCVVFAAGFKNFSNTVAFNTPKWEMNLDTSGFRIMSWNVEQFISSFSQNLPQAKTRIAMLKSIQAYQPDIICMQEYVDVNNTRESWYASVKRELDSLGYKYAYTSNDSVITKWRGVVITEGCAIYSLVPLLDSGRTNITSRERIENLAYVDVVLHNKRLRVFTAHLKSLGLYIDTLQGGDNKNIYKVTYERKRRIEYKLREKELEHEKEVAIIRTAMAKSPYPVIFCGDLNSTPPSYTYNYLRGGLQDAFLEKGAWLGGTFYKLPSTVRIDVCLPDKNFQVLQFTVPQLYLSDHFPIVADLKWK